MKRYFVVLLALFISGCASFGSNEPLTTVERVELDRYMGEWFVIANIPYFGERGNLAGRAIYRPRDDGRMDDIYLYKEGDFDQPDQRMEGVAWVVDEQTNARWKVRFFWPFRFDYVIIELDEDYQWVVVGHPSRDYAWIMAREPQMESSLYQELLERLDAQGFDSGALRKVAQFPYQVGQPGFQ